MVKSKLDSPSRLTQMYVGIIFHHLCSLLIITGFFLLLVKDPSEARNIPETLLMGLFSLSKLPLKKRSYPTERLFTLPRTWPKVC